MLAMLAYAGLRWGNLSVLFVSVACLTVMWLADAKQVLAVVPLAVGVLYLKGRGVPRTARAVPRSGRSTTRRSRGRSAGPILATRARRPRSRSPATGR